MSRQLENVSQSKLNPPRCGDDFTGFAKILRGHSSEESISKICDVCDVEDVSHIAHSEMSRRGATKKTETDGCGAGVQATGLQSVM